MGNKYPNLTKPLRVGGLTLKNRMFSAPTAFPSITAEGFLTWEAIGYYELKAKGGAAVVTVSEAITHFATGKSHSKHINLQAPGVIESLTQCARSIKRHGAAASIELSHGGMFHSVENNDPTAPKEPWGAGDYTMADGTHVREMPKELIGEIVKSFEDGAALIKRAGFDMALLHGGHGWLIHQFLSPVTNTRTDEYGGSLENRARLALEIIAAIKRGAGADFPIEFRMSAEEYQPGGWELDEAIELAKLLDGRVELLHVSTGSHVNSFYRTHPSMFDERGCNVRYAAEIKKHVSTPVVTLGALCDPAEMEEIIASGKADAVAMARALIADPFLPKKVEAGRGDDILRCARCYLCHSERTRTQTRICQLNPLIGREFEGTDIIPAIKRRTVLVAGGGPAGLEAAITAQKRGHSVILCEKSPELGGALKAERDVTFKADVYSLIGVKSRELMSLGADVRLNTEVTPELIAEICPDVLIIALGAEPFYPPIEGIRGANVISANDLAARAGDIGRRVAVLGGGLVGCETAVHLGMTGHDVSVIEMAATAAADCNPLQRGILMEKLGECADVYTGMRAVRATESGLICTEPDGTARLFEADTIICAAGQRPRAYDKLLGIAPETVVIGDCVKPGDLREAIYRGYHAGLDC